MHTYITEIPRTFNVRNATAVCEETFLFTLFHVSIASCDYKDIVDTFKVLLYKQLDDRV